MLGATSGETSGKITHTDISVAIAPYEPMTGMCAGDYECNLGDSGAGIFDCRAKDVLTVSTNANTYGIQSSGEFLNGKWAGVSYFTPISKVS